MQIIPDGQKSKEGGESYKADVRVAPINWQQAWQTIAFRIQTDGSGKG